MGKKFRSLLSYCVGSVISTCVLFLLDKKSEQDTNGWTTVVSKSHNGSYLAKFTGGNNRIRLRIYDARSGKMLAERYYSDGYSLDLEWRRDRVIYQTSDSTGYSEEYIRLPPTYLDWVFARLP